MLGREPVKLRSLHEASKLTLPLLNSSAFETVSPFFKENGYAKRNFGIFPEVSACLVEDCLVSPYTPGLLKSDSLILPKTLIHSRDRITTDSASMFYFDDRLSISNLPSAQNLSSGIHVCGAGSFNWFHFVLECLPKCLLAQRLPHEYSTFPLILPDECRRIPAFADALVSVLGARDAVFLKRGEFASVRNLIVIEDVNVSPFNMVPGHWPKVDDYFQSDEFVKDFCCLFRSKFLDASKVSGPKRRLFLARPERVRRDYNQNELLKISARYGFEPFYPEAHGLRDQAKFFSTAEFIVGPSGAAWVGLIFAEKKVKGLSWLPREYREFCSYSTLAHLLGHELEFLVAEPGQHLANTNDAYTSSYKIQPREFESALQRLTRVNENIWQEN